MQHPECSAIMRIID
ncbi:antirestriction protein [Escherichia coli]|nr:hypothetical protein [Escherichia coli]EKY2613117.1 hypothetical protein [Escherichia coli]HCO0833905.1 hypothetical protein [Escherichia coli]HCO1101195.1 hypothetical protein [Escherichia coli]